MVAESIYLGKELLLIKEVWGMVESCGFSDPASEKKDDGVQTDCPDCGSEKAIYNDTGLYCPDCG